MDKIIQLIAGSAGALGFALIFQLNRKYLADVALGGFLTWLCYLAVSPKCDGIFLPTLIASFLCAMYSEFMARVLLAPSTIFFMSSVIPLIPGSSLFYCMNALAEGNLTAAQHYFGQTFCYALGIAGGMGIAWCLCDFSRKLRTARRNHL